MDPQCDSENQWVLTTKPMGLNHLTNGQKWATNGLVKRGSFFFTEGRYMVALTLSV